MRSAERSERPGAGAVERLLSGLLRTGVVASLSVVVFGTIVTFVHHPGYLKLPPALKGFTQAGAPCPSTFREVAVGIGQFRGQAIVAAGLLLLIATPVLRVAVSMVAFACRKDRIFLAITLTVLLMMVLPFVLGRVGL
jgi:uncharacterized membrane protein